MNNDLIRVKHMKDAVDEILKFSTGKKRKDLDDDRLLSLGLVHLLEIFGEAASRVSSTFKEKYPGIPWRAIIDMRNELIHGYFDIDLDIVWNTIKKDIPPLESKLQEIINKESN